MLTTHNISNNFEKNCFDFRELDSAFLRRFERKMLCGLPDLATRIAIIHKFLPISKNWLVSELNDLAQLADGFTGDDIRVAAKEASMKMVRAAIEAAEKCKMMHPNFWFYF